MRPGPTNAVSRVERGCRDVSFAPLSRSIHTSSGMSDDSATVVGAPASSGVPSKDTIFGAPDTEAARQSCMGGGTWRAGALPLPAAEGAALAEAASEAADADAAAEAVSSVFPPAWQPQAPADAANASAAPWKKSFVPGVRFTSPSSGKG